jgi:hypothetical protein
VLDLSFIPEKYRLDSQRAESIVKRSLSLWRQNQTPTQISTARQGP